LRDTVEVKVEEFLNEDLNLLLEMHEEYKKELQNISPIISF